MYGERIRDLRKEKKLTLRELSNELDIPFTTLGNYEREDRGPNFDVVEKIADYFNVTIDYLYGKTNERSYDIKFYKREAEKVEDLLRNADPDIRRRAVDINDQLYLILRNSLQSEPTSDIKAELDRLFEIVNFIFRLKNGFTWIKYSDDELSSPSSKEEIYALYLKEKNELDKHFNELLELYTKGKYPKKGVE